MSKFCQHPDCPKTTQGLEQCPLCGYPVKRQPKPTDAHLLAGTMAATGCLSQIISFILIASFVSVFRFLPEGVVQFLIFTTLAFLPTGLTVGFLWTRRKDIQIVANTLDADKFQREVNNAIEIGYRWAVIAGAALAVGLPVTFMKGNVGYAPAPFALLAFSAVSIGIPVSICEFIYSKQLRNYRKKANVKE